MFLRDASRSRDDSHAHLAFMDTFSFGTFGAMDTRTHRMTGQYQVNIPVDVATESNPGSEDKKA